ncbi:hypothetical protein DW828_16375 [Parabacteroides merdae]|uniref:Uncharacterized protein n=1 Tax=Parabacteroides merdae TaxID=46503 RepID=A0A414BUD5_9BACT|nr:hypothetical protein DW828_16375 [Parabacteroides merdae]
MLLSEFGKKKPINSTLSLNKVNPEASIKRISATQSYVCKVNHSLKIPREYIIASFRFVFQLKIASKV